MLTHLRAAAVPRRALPSHLPQPPEPGAALIESLGAVDDEDHILLLGEDGPDLMCALLRAGAPQVTHLRSPERLEADSASLVIVPHVPSLDWLEGALCSSRHALRGGPPDAQRRSPRVRYSPARLTGAMTMRNPIFGIGGSLTALATPF